MDQAAQAGAIYGVRIFGIHINPDSIWALIVNGQILYAVGQRPFARTRYDCCPPALAVEQRLGSQNLTKMDTASGLDQKAESRIKR